MTLAASSAWIMFESKLICSSCHEMIVETFVWRPRLLRCCKLSSGCYFLIFGRLAAGWPTSEEASSLIVICSVQQTTTLIPMASGPTRPVLLADEDGAGFFLGHQYLLLFRRFAHIAMETSLVATLNLKWNQTNTRLRL
jgi:hypothetical protein